MADDPSTPPEQVPYTREFIMDAGYASRAAAALVKRLIFRRPTFWIGIAAAVLAALLAIAGVDEMLWVGIGLLLFSLLLPGLVYFQVRTRYGRQFPAGSVLRSGFGETRFANEAPHFATVVEYSTYSGARREGEFVLLRQRVSNQWALFPGALFGDEDLARFPQR